MENETQVEQPDNRERNAVHEKNKVQAKSARSSKKTILVAVVISVITIGALAILRGQIDSPRKEAAAVGHSVAALDKTMASRHRCGYRWHEPSARAPPQTGGTFEYDRAQHRKPDRADRSVVRFFTGRSFEHESGAVWTGQYCERDS